MALCEYLHECSDLEQDTHKKKQNPNRQQKKKPVENN